MHAPRANKQPASSSPLRLSRTLSLLLPNDPLNRLGVVLREARAEGVVLVDGEGHVLDHLLERRVGALVDGHRPANHEEPALDELILAAAVGLDDLAILRRHEGVVRRDHLGVHLAVQLADQNLGAVFEAVHAHAHPVGQAILAVHEFDFHALAVGREAIVAEADDHVAVHLLEEVVPGNLGRDFSLAQLLVLPARRQARNLLLASLGADRHDAADGPGGAARADPAHGRRADEVRGGKSGRGHLNSCAW
mmetsp:Transcript_6420/g.28265  ORF Transcript_6420/g.28265 Transcript_6420/m.28265 type:complete len:250 (-) Transcript_6420:43-792(-)